MAQSHHGAHTGQKAERGAESASDDLRAVSSVLHDIMPVLNRIQSRNPQAAALGLFGQMSVESLAAVALVTDLGADSLRRLTAFLDANVGKHEGLENCAPVVAAAARALSARDYAQAFTHIFEAYRAIALMQMEDLEIPSPSSVSVVMDAARPANARDDGTAH
jgi:hypothetical protein